MSLRLCFVFSFPSFRDAPQAQTRNLELSCEIPGSRFARPGMTLKRYAPIAIFGSASAFAFNSCSARRYSTGITLRNFGR
jgi:hypothetical protein